MTGRRGGRQVIPRPADCALGEAAPWAVLSARQRTGITVRRVVAAVRASHGALGVSERLSVGGFPDPRAPAAVLVPVFEEAGEARVVLTRRSAHLRTHTGEVSFPGGRLDAAESPEDAAIREAAEEVALEPGSVRIVGRLSALATFSSGTTITPVVGVLPSRQQLRANPGEVEHVFDVALAELLADDVFREERWSVPGRPVPSDPDGSFPVWFFELDEDTIWGATARVLMELLRLVLDL